jgi:GDP-mannose pyrophosphatase NudK
MTKDRITITGEEILSKRWLTLTRYSFDYRRRDGSVQKVAYEVHDHGDAACILLYNLEKDTVVLVRQFRLPPHLKGDNPDLIEVCAGLLDGDAPDVCARREAEEETGFRIGQVEKLWEAYASPGALTEKLHVFAAPYDPTMRVSDGGGLVHEGEEIEVLEIPFTEIRAMIADGRIMDSKTIALLLWAESRLGMGKGG